MSTAPATDSRVAPPGSARPTSSPRMLLAGMALTPFGLFRVISGVGVSLGDLLIVLGGAFLVVRSWREDARASPKNKWIVPAFIFPGLLVALGILISGIARQEASAGDVFSLVLQHLMVLVFLPIVLSLSSMKQRVSLARAYLLGFAASVVLGLALVVFFPSSADSLRSRGLLVAVASGTRNGLFAGVGELSKMAGLALPLAYILLKRTFITVRAAAFFLAMSGISLIVTRSGSGFLAASAIALVIVVLEVARTRSGRPRDTGRTGRALRVLTAAAFGSALVFLAISYLDASENVSFRAEFIERVAEPLAGGVEEVGSARVRVELIEESWTIIGQYPILGTGPGLYLPGTRFGARVHVVPAMLWAESGVVPLAGWLAMMTVLGVSTLSLRRHDYDAFVSMAAVWIGFLAVCVSATYLYHRALAVPVLLVAFLALHNDSGIEPTKV